MDNSDDYFTDDLILDDETLAVLDAEESKYNQSHPRPTVTEPPAKRQKLAERWNAPPRTNPNRSSPIDDLELPEISVRGGFYGLPGGQSQSQSQSRSQCVGSQRSQLSQSTLQRIPSAVIGMNIPLPRSRHGTPAAAMAAAHAQKVISRQPTRSLSRSVSHPASSQGLSRHPSNASTSSLSNRHVPHLAPHLTQSGPFDPALDPRRLQEELMSVRTQLEALKQSKAEMEATLQGAITEKRSKAGEVVILRQNIDKLNQNHIAEQAKLRAAKEAAEAMQIHIQLNMKEEMERLKTQYTFHKHELETSTRKPLLSAPGPRATQPQMQTQTQLRRSRPASPVAGPSDPRHTPTRDLQRHPGPRPPPPPSKAKAKQAAALPGFVNAFLPSSPHRPRQGKGKEKEPLFARTQSFGRGESQWDLDAGPPSPPSSPVPMQSRSKDRHGRTPRKEQAVVGYDDDMGIGEVRMDMDMDVDADMSFSMDVDATPRKAAEKPPAEEFDEPEPPDWVGRLHQIVFLHTLPSRSNTFQTLLSESSSLGDDAAAYNRASSAILDALGSLSNSANIDIFMRTVSRGLLQMADLLHSHNLIASFTALLNLLTTLIISIPRFIDTLFNSAVSSYHKHAQLPDLLATLCNGLVIHLTPDRLRGKDVIVDRTEHIDLAKELVTLLDAIVWSVPTDYENRLNTIPRTAGVLSTLLNPAHSKWFLRQSTRLVSLLATRTNNFRHLLSYPDSPSAKAGSQRDYTSIPHIDQMCSLLSDPKKSGPDADVMRRYILSFFTLLATSHPDALTILAESKNLLPSLVVHLGDLTVPLWEEDAALMSAPAQIDATIEAITHTLLLLHYLVFRAEQPPSLRQRLHQARHVNGIHHTFVVTLGRLAFGLADAPDEVQARCGGGVLDQIAEVARDVMDLVVEGPESECVWAVYHPEGESGSERDVDEAEIEARMMDAEEG